MKDSLSDLRRANAFEAIDVELARGLSRLVGETREEVLLAVALASRATRDGHVCADMRRLSGSDILGEDGKTLFVCPSLELFRQSLSTSELVTDGSRSSPLVFDGKDRLYLRKHWEHEERLARALILRSTRHVEPKDPAALGALARRLFGERGPEDDWQRVAAQIAAVSTLTIVSGGPGTGKTSTVTKILALALSDLVAAGNPRPRALLLAPTGKAAARLAEATRAAVATLPVPAALAASIPTEAKTVHRALETDREGRFRTNAERPLFADVIVVDEASMIDVALMRHLVEAVPAATRLVLLGDHHQLSSVEAGAVLADICGDSSRGKYSRATAERVHRAFGEELPRGSVVDAKPGIDDCVVFLTRSFRFSESSGLGALSHAIRSGDADGAVALLRSEAGVSLLEAKTERGADERLLAAAVAGSLPLLAEKTSEAAFDRLGAFRVLCGNRAGPIGVVEMNRAIDRVLRAKGGRSRVVCPIVIQTNDPALELFNGDVGLIVKDEGGMRAAFPGKGDALRFVSLARLPPHEPAFAMSIHKSQGSEFDEVLVVLPSQGSPLLTRELLYTAVTRAKKSVRLHGTIGAVREAVSRASIRASGLSDRLREDPGQASSLLRK